MSEPFRRRLAGAAVLAATAFAAAGCGSVDGVSNRIVGAITPYRIEVVQGNFVSKEQVSALQPGMGRLQVREVLGTPLLTSVFHANRWDYVFTIRRPGVEPQARRLSVFFKNEVLERFEGDDMPTEAEFVATLDRGRKGGGKVPVLEASEDSLKRYAPRPRTAADQAAAAAPDASTPASYPPLETLR